MRDLTLIQFEYDRVPYGALYLAHGLHKESINFNLKLYPVNTINLDKLYSFFINSEDIIAIGCMIDMLPWIIAVLKRIKKIFPKKIVILGGTGPAESAEQILHRFDFINFIIRGCGVYSLPKLIKKIKTGETTLHDVVGLIYRNKRKIVSNSYNYYPDFKVFPVYNCNCINFELYSIFPLVTSRGYPYECTFCISRQTIEKKIVYRNFDEVIEEIRLIKQLLKNRSGHVKITDEAFIVNRNRVIEFCSLLRANKLDIPWLCYGRIDRMDEELLKIMSKSGCESIFYGLESGSNGILKK